MKVTMTEELELIITPESPTEALALRYWLVTYTPDNAERCKSRLVVTMNLPAKGDCDG